MASCLVRCRDAGAAMISAGPKAFHGVDVYFMKAIPIIIPGILATAVTDTCMRIAPLFQAAINVVLVRIHTRAQGNRGLDQGFDRPLWDVFSPPNHHLTAALDHPEDRGLLRCKGATAALPLKTSAPAAPPFFSTCSGFPLWPAIM
jgi:hypothetical protein